MNESGENPLTNSDTPDTKPCSLISIIPTIGMSSCRGRAEAFARRLSSKLRTLGSQNDEDKDLTEDEPIINGIKNTWIPSGDNDLVTELQPGRHESDGFFEYECDLESPGSPVDECEYLRLIETASNTPHNSAGKSGYVCESIAASSHSSNDDHCLNSNYNDHDETDSIALPKNILNSINITEYPSYINVLKVKNQENFHPHHQQQQQQHQQQHQQNSITNSNNEFYNNKPTTNGDHLQDEETEEEETQTKFGLSNHYNSNSNSHLHSSFKEPNEKLNDCLNKTATAKLTFPVNHTTTAKSEKHHHHHHQPEQEDMVKIQNDILEELHNLSSSKALMNQALVVEKENHKTNDENHEPNTFVIRDHDSHTYTFLHSLTNGLQSNDRDEVLQIEVTSEDSLVTETQPINGCCEILKVNVSQGQENASLLIASTEAPKIEDDLQATKTNEPSIVTNNIENLSNLSTSSTSSSSSLKTDLNSNSSLNSISKLNSSENENEKVNDKLVEKENEREKDSEKEEREKEKQKQKETAAETETEREKGKEKEKEPEREKENSTGSNQETTDDEEDCRPQRVRRCSSLKTGKTPPGTPGRKKIVRFADVLGLDLADVKTFLDEVPTIPKSAFMDLEIMDSEPPIQLGPRSDKLLMPLFQQPGGLPSFLDIVREKQVSLENASVTDILNQTITGTVRVRNLDFHKSVYIRYTLDNWRSFADLQANYLCNSCDGFSDKFTFVLFGNSLQIGQRLEFAVRFQCKGQQFWDNNYGTNYCFQCLAAGNPLATTVTSFVPAAHPVSNVVGLLSPTAGEAWCNSFY